MNHPPSLDGPDRSLVYPVLSRRAGGLSVGINLSPGKECNWACRYCEVEGLVRGTPPSIDLDQLTAELNDVLESAKSGAWNDATGSPAEVKDLCIAGDGEPTLSPDFGEAVGIVADARERHGLEDTAKLVTISNGSRSHVIEVQRGLSRLGRRGGELWFKMDGGTAEARERINGTAVPDASVVAGLVEASRRVPTWIQTMLLAIDGNGPGGADMIQLVTLIRRAIDEGARPRGILAYGFARPSFQPGGEALSALAPDELASLVRRLEVTGLDVRCFV